MLLDIQHEGIIVIIYIYIYIQCERHCEVNFTFCVCIVRETACCQLCGYCETVGGHFHGQVHVLLKTVTSRNVICYRITRYPSCCNVAHSVKCGPFVKRESVEQLLVTVAKNGMDRQTDRQTDTQAHLHSQ